MKEELRIEKKEETVVEIRFSTKEEAMMFVNKIAVDPEVIGSPTYSVKPYYPRYFWKDQFEMAFNWLKGQLKKLTVFSSSII